LVYSFRADGGDLTKKRTGGALGRERTAVEVPSQTRRGYETLPGGIKGSQPEQREETERKSYLRIRGY